VFSWVEEPHLTQKLLCFIEDHEACRTSLGMSPGDGPEAGKHDEKIQADWFREMGHYVLKDDSSGRWDHITDDKVLGPIIRNRVNK
jgi:hypothetical protein